MNYKIVIFPLFLLNCLINQASPNCQQQPKVKHGHSSSSSNVFSFNNFFNQQESSNNQQTWNSNSFFNPFELTFKAPGQTSQPHLGDNSNILLVNPKVNNLASTSASSSSSSAPLSPSKANGGQIHATNRQLFAPGLFDFFQEQPPKVNVNSHSIGQTVNKGTSVAPKKPSQEMKQLTPLESLKSSSELSSSSSTESTSFSEFPSFFSGLVSTTDEQDDAHDLLGMIQQHQSQWGQNLPTQLTDQKQGTKVPKVSSGASSLSSASSFASSSSFPSSSLSLGEIPLQQQLLEDDSIKTRQQLQNSGLSKILQEDNSSSSVASSPANFNQLLSNQPPKNGQGIEKDYLTSLFSGDSSSSDSASTSSTVKSINQINQLQSTEDLIKLLQSKQSVQQQNIESQSPHEQLLSSSVSSSSSVPKVTNLGHISKSHEKHPAADFNYFFRHQSDNQNRHSIVDRGNKGTLNVPAQAEQKANEQTKPLKTSSSVTIPLLTFPSTPSGRPERSGSANIHSQNSKNGQTGTSVRMDNHGSVKKPVTNTDHDILFSSFSSSFAPVFNSALQIQSNEQQNLADLATIIQRQQNQKLTDQQKSNKDQSRKSSQTLTPSSSSSIDSSFLSTEQIQKLNSLDLLKLIQQQNNGEKTNSDGDLVPKIGQNSAKNNNQSAINTNKPSSPSSQLASNPARLIQYAQTSVLPSSTFLSSSISSQDNAMSNQQIINQSLNLPVQNEKSVEHRQTQTEQNQQSNKQKTPSLVDSQSSLQPHSKLDLKTPIQSSPIEQVDKKIKNQRPIPSHSPTITSSLTTVTDLSSLSTDQIQQLTKAELIALLQNQNNKEKPTSQESLVTNIRQNSDKSKNKPTSSSSAEASSSSSVSSSALLTLPTTTPLKQMLSSSAAGSVTASEATLAAVLSSLSDSDDEDDDDDDETDDEESTEESSGIIKQSVRPVQIPITSSSIPTDSLSTERMQKLNTAESLKSIQEQNSKTKITSQESLSPIIGQNNDKSANQPTLSPYVKSASSPSASLSTSKLASPPSTTEDIFLPNIEQISVKSKNKPTVSSDAESSSTSSSNSAASTLPSKLSKQIPSSSEIDLPLSVDDTLIATGAAIATASALSSSASSLLSAAQVQSSPSSNLSSKQQSNDLAQQKTNLSGPSNKPSQTSIAHPSTIPPSPIPSQDIMTSTPQIITPNLSKPTLSSQTSSTSTQAKLLSQPSPLLGINSEKSSDHQQVQTNSENPIQAKNNSHKNQQKTPSRVGTSHSKSIPQSLVSLPLSLSTNSGQLHTSNRQPIGSTRLKHQQNGKNENIHSTESQTNRLTSIIQSSKVPIDASKTSVSTSNSPSSVATPESISTLTSSVDSTQVAPLIASSLNSPLLDQSGNAQSKGPFSNQPSLNEQVTSLTSPFASSSSEFASSTHDSTQSNESINSQTYNVPALTSESLSSTSPSTGSRQVFSSKDNVQHQNNQQQNSLKSGIQQSTITKPTPFTSKVTQQPTVKTSGSTSSVSPAFNKEQIASDSSEVMEQKSKSGQNSHVISGKNDASLSNKPPTVQQSNQQTQPTETLTSLLHTNQPESQTNKQQDADRLINQVKKQSQLTQSEDESALQSQSDMNKQSQNERNNKRIESLQVKTPSRGRTDKNPNLKNPIIIAGSSSSSPLLFAQQIEVPETTDLSKSGQQTTQLSGNTRQQIGENLAKTDSSQSSVSSISSQADLLLLNDNQGSPNNPVMNEGQSLSPSRTVVDFKMKSDEQHDLDALIALTQGQRNKEKSTNSGQTKQFIDRNLTKQGLSAPKINSNSLSTASASKLSLDNVTKTSMSPNNVELSSIIHQMGSNIDSSSTSSFVSSLLSAEQIQQLTPNDLLKLIQEKNNEKTDQEVFNRDKLEKSSQASASSSVPSLLSAEQIQQLTPADLLQLIKQRNDGKRLDSTDNSSPKNTKISDKNNSKLTVSTDARSSSSVPSANVAVFTLPSTSISSKQTPSSASVSSAIDLPLASATATAAATALLSASALSSLDSDSSPVSLPLLQSSSKDDLQLANADSTDQHSDIVTPSTIPAQTLSSSPSSLTSSSSLSTDLSPIKQIQKLNPADLPKLEQEQNSKGKTNEGSIPNVKQNSNKSKNQPTINIPTPSSPSTLSASTPVLPASPSQDIVISNQPIINQNLNLPVKNEKSADQRQTQTNSEKLTQTEQNKQSDKQKTPSTIESQSSLQSDSESNLKIPVQFQSSAIEQAGEKSKNHQEANASASPTTPWTSPPITPPVMIGSLIKSDDTISSPSSTSSLTSITDLSSLSTDQIQQLTKAELIALLQNQNNKEKPTSQESLVTNIRQNSDNPTKLNTDAESSSTSSDSSSNLALQALAATSKPAKQIPNSSDVSSKTVLPTSAKATVVPILSSSSDSDSSSSVSSLLLTAQVQASSPTDLTLQQPNNDLTKQKTNLSGHSNQPFQSSISSQSSTISNPQILNPNLNVSILTNEGYSSNLALLALPSTSELSKQLTSNSDVNLKTNSFLSATVPATPIATAAALSPPSKLSSSNLDSDSFSVSLPILQASSSDKLSSQNGNEDSVDQQSDMVKPSEKGAQTPVTLPSPSPSSSSSSTDLSSNKQTLKTELLEGIQQQKNKEEGVLKVSIAPKTTQSNKNDNQPSISANASLKQQNNKFDKTSKESEERNVDQINGKDTKVLTISSGESTSSSPNSAQSSIPSFTLTLPLTSELTDQIPSKSTVSSETDLPLPAADTLITTEIETAKAPALSSSNSVTLQVSQSNGLGLQLAANDSTDQQSDIVRKSKEPAQITIASTSFPLTSSSSHSSSTDSSVLSTTQNQKLTATNLLKQIQKQNNKEETSSEESSATNIGLNSAQSKEQKTMTTSRSHTNPSLLTLPSTTKLSSSESALRSQTNRDKQITSGDRVNAETDLSLSGATNAMNTASTLSSFDSSEKKQSISSDNLHQNKGTADKKSGNVKPVTWIAPSSLSSSSLSTALSSLSTEQIKQLTPEDLIKLLKQQNNQVAITPAGDETRNSDKIEDKDTKPLTISSDESSSSTTSSTSALLVQPSASIPSVSESSSSSSSSGFDSASALSALSLLSAEQINQLTTAELIKLIQQQNNQREINLQGRESSLSTNLSSLSGKQIQQFTLEDLIKLVKQQNNQSIKTIEGSLTSKADQINDKGTIPITTSSDASSTFSSPTLSATSVLLTSPSTTKISSDVNTLVFNNKQIINGDHMSSKTGLFSPESTSSSPAAASALLSPQIPQASSVDSLSDLKQQHGGVIIQNSGPSRLSEHPPQTQITVQSASSDSTSLSNEQMQQLSQADLIELLKQQNNKFDKTSKLGETNNTDQSKNMKSTLTSTDASSTSTLLVFPSASSDSSSAAIVPLDSRHQNKGMNGKQEGIVRPTSASSSLSAQQQTTDLVKQIQNENIESNNKQISNIDEMKASSQESTLSATGLSSLSTERQLTATELLNQLKQQNNQWTINRQGGESPNNEPISNTGNKESTSPLSTTLTRTSPSPSASSTPSSSSTSSTVSLLASSKQSQHSDKLKQQNVELTDQQSLNHVLLNEPSQVPIVSLLPSSSTHKDQHVDNRRTKLSMKNTNQSPKDSLLPPAPSTISSELASSTSSFDVGQINPINRESTQGLSQESSTSSDSFNQQGKQSFLSTHTHPDQEVKHASKLGETSSSLATAPSPSSSSSSTSTSASTPLLISSINPTSSVQVNTQQNQKDRGSQGKQTSDFNTGKQADVINLPSSSSSSSLSSSASLTPSMTLDGKSPSNQRLTLDDLVKLVQQQQQNNQWSTNSQGDRASVGQLLSAIGSINEPAQSSSSTSSIPFLNVDQKQMGLKNQLNQNIKTESQSMQMNKQGSTNPIISKNTSVPTSASSGSSSESSSSSSIASADKIQLSKQQQLDLIKLIQQTQWNSKESAALASQLGINQGATLLSPISSSSSTQSSESVPSSFSLSTTNTEQVYFSKKQIVAYLIALIQAQLAKSPQAAKNLAGQQTSTSSTSSASSSSSSFSSTYESTQNFQTDEQQIVVLLIEILQQQQQKDHPISSLLSLLSKNLFIISELPPQLLSLLTSLFTTSLSPKAEHLSTINNQMTSADLKRMLQQIKQQSEAEKQSKSKSQIGSQGEQTLDSSQLISALSRLSSMPQTSAPSVAINPVNVQTQQDKQWNLNSQQQAAIKALQSSQQYKPLDDPSAASTSMDSQLFEYPILMDPTNTKGLIPTMEDIAEQGILTLENFASDLLGR